MIAGLLRAGCEPYASLLHVPTSVAWVRSAALFGPLGMSLLNPFECLCGSRLTHVRFNLARYLLLGAVFYFLVEGPYELEQAGRWEAHFNATMSEARFICLCRSSSCDFMPARWALTIRRFDVCRQLLCCGQVTSRKWTLTRLKKPLTQPWPQRSKTKCEFAFASHCAVSAAMSRV